MKARWFSGLLAMGLWFGLGWQAAAIGADGDGSGMVSAAPADSQSDVQTDGSDSGDAADGLDLETAPPDEVVARPCCIPSRDECVNRMSASECREAAGTPVRSCRFCAIMLMPDAEGTSPGEAPAGQPIGLTVGTVSTLVGILSMFMLP